MMRKKSILCVLILAAISIAYFWQKIGVDYLEPVNELQVAKIDKNEVSEKIDTATKKSLVVDNNTQEIKTTLIEAPVGLPVQGLVTNHLGHGISQMQVEIRHKTSATPNTKLFKTSTDATGQFLFDAIPQNGEHRLEVRASKGYTGAQIKPFVLTNDMPLVEIILDGVDLTSAQGFLVDGNFAPIANFKFLVQNLDISYPGKEIVSDSSGYFQLSEFPAGDVQLTTNTENDEHFQIAGISLKPGEYSDLTLMFDKGQYHLSGWVSDEFNTPIPQARILMTAVLPNEEYRSTSYRLKISNSDGIFKFSNLSGHEHKIVVDAYGYDSYELNHQFQSSSENLNIQLKEKSE